MLKGIALIFSFILSANLSFPQELSTWRGPDRDGVYHEQGLLKKWPDEGPKILWKFEGLGQGFSSPAFANGKIYLTGMTDFKGHVFIFSENGTLQNKFEYGPEFHATYPGARSVPLVADDLLYIVSGMGKLLCFNADTGHKIWSRDAIGDFDGSNIRWGITENLLIDGNKIFFAPGGKRDNIVALDRFNGDLIWSSQGTGKGDLSAYCSPLLVKFPEREILVTMMQNEIVGIDAGNGQFLWSHPHTNGNKIHANNPLYKDGSIFAFSYEAGSVRLKLNEDGSSITKVWSSTELDPLQGGVIILDGYIYGSGRNNIGWFCVDWESGKTLWNSRELAWGAVIFADSKLYIYSSRGELAMVKPNPVKLEIVSQTKITIGTEQHFSHPVIHNGMLYIRRGNAMVVFNISG